jgi:hypothetical protein
MLGWCKVDDSRMEIQRSPPGSDREGYWVSLKIVMGVNKIDDEQLEIWWSFPLGV